MPAKPKTKKKKPTEIIASKIRHIPDFPKKGILFHDVTTLIKDYKALNLACQMLYAKVRHLKIDAVAGIESRGFVFGAILATKFKKGMVMIRKEGKLPAKKIYAHYEREYGPCKIEVHIDAIKKGDKVLIVDDLLATGGSMMAACKLIEKLGGKVAACVFLIEMPDLKGRDKLKKYPIYRLVEFMGE